MPSPSRLIARTILGGVQIGLFTKIKSGYNRNISQCILYGYVKVQTFHLTHAVTTNACRISTMSNSMELFPSIRLISHQVCGTRLITLHTKAHHQILQWVHSILATSIVVLAFHAHWTFPSNSKFLGLLNIRFMQFFFVPWVLLAPLQHH